MKAILEHIRHRQVYKVGAIYLALAWLLMQVTVSIEAPLNLPPWADTLVIVILAVGFPVALLLAWAGEDRRGDSPATMDTTGPAMAQTDASRAASAVVGSAGSDADPPGPVRPDRLGASSAPSAGAAAGSARRGEIRFCTTPGGYRLAYARAGAGIPLVRTGNWVSHTELDWELSMYGHVLRDLSARFDLVTYDGRGTGLSDRDVEHFSLETMVEDMETVVDACGLEKFAILAFSQSCAVSVAYAAKHPERVSHMVLVGGFIRNFRTPEAIDAMATLFEQSWGQANPGTRQIFTTALFPDADKRVIDDFNEIQRLSVSPQGAARLFRAVHAIDVREQAKQLTVPTLVMHSRDEEGVPLEYGREIASSIPNARFVALNSRNHIILEHEPAYRQFFDETVRFVSS